MKILRIFFILLFLLIISIPFIFTAFNFNIFKSIDIGENRALVSKDTMQNISISDYPKQIEKYLNDNIAFRKQIIKIYHYIFAWNLYSPVSDYFIRVNDEAYAAPLIKRYLETPSLERIPFLEILSGINLITNYYNCKFIYLTIPDKISLWENHLPQWMLEFKRRHYIPSFYEYVQQHIHGYDFADIDLLTTFKQSSRELFAKRYDYYHYNHNGLDLTMKEIASHIDGVNNKKFNYNDFENGYFFKNKEVETVPRVGKYKYESIPFIYAEENFNRTIKIEENPYKIINKDKTKIADYLINKKNDGGINLLISTDSSFKSIGMDINIKGINGKIIPLIYGVNKYMHTSLYENISYEYLINYLQFINADAFVYAITERMLGVVPKDKIFQIAGRYALGKNENFIFPEDIVFSSEKISSADIEINKNNKYVNINKQLITDKNGEIYISFRYKSPKKTKAVLEYSSNKDFSNSKRVSTQLNGGGNLEGVSFYIKSNPNQKIYARLIPGNIDGKYVFAEIKELREKR